jgi:hypothetical protein
MVITSQTSSAKSVKTEVYFLSLGGWWIYLYIAHKGLSFWQYAVSVGERKQQNDLHTV